MNLYSEFALVEQGNANKDSVSGEEVPEEEDEWYTADPKVTAVSDLQNVNNVLARGFGIALMTLLDVDQRSGRKKGEWLLSLMAQTRHT